MLVQAVPLQGEGTAGHLAGMSFEAKPQQPAAAFLLQHQVQGHALLPGAAMMESCYAAASMLTGSAYAVLIRVPLSNDSLANAFWPLSCVICFAVGILTCWGCTQMGKAIYSCP